MSNKIRKDQTNKLFKTEKEHHDPIKQCHLSARNVACNIKREKVGINNDGSGEEGEGVQ